jgi:hypothetical protein
MIRCVNRQCALQKRKKNMRLAAEFCLFMGTSPINFGLLGGNGNTLKLEITTKLKDKQTSTATVRDLLQTFATFPAPPFFSLQTTFKVNLKKKIYLYVNSTTQRCPNKTFRTFLICHRCQRQEWRTLIWEYLCKFSKKFETALMGYSRAWRKLVHEKYLN